jgi:hypothetical protein
MHLFAIFTYWQDSTSSTHNRHEKYSTYKMLIIKSKGKRPVWRSRPRQECKIKMDFTEKEYKEVIAI